MSLFGTSPDNLPARSKQSLFDDEQNPVNKTNTGLFDDESNAGGDSPWAFPTPKKGARRNLAKSLLPASDVPDSYIDAFDALLEIGEKEGNGISLAGIERVLSGSGLSTADQSKVLQIVIPGGQDSAAGISRPEFNVLLALIGLAQEGEDITLDGVDERRKNLPQPSIPALKVALPPKPKQQQEAPQNTQSPATANIHYAPPPESPPQPRTMRKPSFGIHDQDPWGSPALHRGHNHPSSDPATTKLNGSSQRHSSPIPSRNTSTFAAGPEQSLTTAQPKKSSDHNSTREEGAGADWSGYGSSSAEGFTDGATVGDEGFGSSGVDERQGQDRSGLRRPIGGGKVSGAGPEETVRITVLPDKEGIFLFQHRNYEVMTVRRHSKVIRRYSDFVWLLDCLHKKYPFRQLPLLPPKRVAINGNHIAADNLFIEKRRRGLVRFTNALVRHPVLAQEQLVVMFLTVPTMSDLEILPAGLFADVSKELAVWRKQATISVQEEFVGRTLPPTLEDSLPPNLQDIFETVRSGVRRSAEIYINLCNLVERLIKRREGIAADYLRLSQALLTLTEASSDTYNIDTNDVPMLNEGINSSAKHISTSQSLLEDEGKGWVGGALEDFKRQRDCLVSMRDMFDRRDRYAKNNIDQLEKRIKSNENKLAAIRAKPEGQVKPGEAEKVEDAIVKDKQSIVDQHNRGIFIKECIRDELLFFQRSQYHVSKLHQDWSQERVKYAELQADNWRALSEELESMPTGA